MRCATRPQAAIPGAPAGDLPLGRSLCLLGLAALALFVGSLEYEFVWDDRTIILQNPLLGQARAVPRFFREDVTSLTGGALHAPYYRPLFWLSLAMDFHLWGTNPAGFHLTNVLLYAAACLLVLLLAHALLGPGLPAFLAALLFAVHPAHVETVAWIAGRCDPMPAIGLVAAVLAYLAARAAAGPARRAALVAAGLAAFGAALLAKESAVTLPALLLWIEVVLPDTSARARWLRPAPFAVLALIYLGLRQGALTRWTEETLSGGALWARLPGSLELIARYVHAAFLPIGLQPVYDLPRPETILAPWPMAGLALLGLGGLLAWRLRHIAPVASLGVGWFFLALGPVLDLVPISPRPLNYADRHLFIPSIGIALLCGALLALPHRSTAGRPIGGLTRRSVWAAPSLWAATVAIALLGVGVLTYAPIFRDDVTLFARVTAQAPAVALGHQNLGLALLRSGDVPGGFAALERAVATEPDNPHAALALAGSHVMAGRPEAAHPILDRIASRLGRQRAFLQVRGLAFLAQGAWSPAAAVLADAVRRYPDFPDLHRLLGQARVRLGDLAGAEAALRTALDLDPRSAEGHAELSLLLLRAGRVPEALGAADAARRLAPDSAAAARSLALALEAAERREAAQRVWEEMLTLPITPAQRAGIHRELGRLGR
jgi:Flp pilus assembly protein TadD